MSCATSSTATCCLLADPAHERGDRGLVRQVEAVERLVEQQQLGPADERLRDQQPLLLAARELADRPARVAGRRRRARSPRATRVASARAAAAGRGAGRPSARRRARAGRGRCRGCACRRRSCAAAAGSRSASFASPGGSAEHARRARPPAAAGRASALISVDLPAPFGPSTATNSPRATVERDVAPDRRARRGAPRRSRRTATAAGSVASLTGRSPSRARPASACELSRLPGLEGRGGGRRASR